MIFRATSGSKLPGVSEGHWTRPGISKQGFLEFWGSTEVAQRQQWERGEGRVWAVHAAPSSEPAFVRARPFLCPSPAQRMDAQSWAHAAFTHQLQPVSVPGGHLCHPQKAAGQGGHRRGRCATLGQHEPRGTLQAHCRNPGSGQGCAHFRAPAGGLGTLFSAEYALCPHRTVCGCLARAHPHTAAPLCRPWLPSAVPGLGGYGCRQLSF